MRLLILLFLMFFVPVTIAQNEWWKTEGNSKNEKEKQIEEIKEGSIEKATVEKKLKANDSIIEPEKIEKGSINIVKSSAIDKIIEFKSTAIPPNSGPLMSGYRVQLFFDQNRKEVDEARSTILEIDDKAVTYVEYKAPNYFLLLGDFRTQLEAEKARSELIEEFPTALVVKDEIHLPKIKEEEEN